MRQLLFFCNSLYNSKLLRPPAVPKQRSLTAFTPHYAEDVSMSLAQLHAVGAESQALLAILKARLATPSSAPPVPNTADDQPPPYEMAMEEVPIKGTPL